MRWLSRVIAAIVDAAAEVVEDVVNAVTEAVADVVETVGNAIGDFFHWLAGRAENIPGIGGAIAAALRWVGNSISAVFEFASSVIKAVGSIIGSAVAGLMRIVGGILSLNGRLILEGLGDIVSGVIIGPVLLILGKLVAAVQTIIPVQGRRRPLTEAERQMLARVYRNGLALYNLRIVDNTAGVFSVNSTPFTLGNTIYLKGENVDPSDPSANEHVLVHESVHVWQYQHEGTSYVGNAIGAQTFFPATNTVSGWQVEISNGRLRWVDFNKEAQSWFVEDVYRFGELISGAVTTSGEGVFFDADGANLGRFERSGVDHTSLANDAVTAIRGQFSARLSRFL